ncbi:hypothetical protein [Psychroflexus sp. ALD_RP9]|uniref:hypothetical protein n=1 Tax=Psychroflexus sp. ALD_RP9 TaxID=2777186 RepID=UPI001A8E9509|nr:hypothetical protein [Psychroflexus sp. ALD_RP9]QSS97968.1 hypothetical protein IMZ30_04445 [Psychroflexus sp. ALD_RP9]
MKILSKLGLFSLAIIALSCSKETPQEVEEFKTLMGETIEIHDEVMPKMSSLNQNIQKLDTLKSIDSLKQQQAIKDLKSAHDQMMSWMKDFSNTFSRAEINQGLQTENLDSIKLKLNDLKNLNKEASEMKKAILNSLEDAQMLLKN